MLESLERRTRPTTVERSRLHEASATREAQYDDERVGMDLSCYWQPMAGTAVRRSSRRAADSTASASARPTRTSRPRRAFPCGATAPGMTCSREGTLDPLMAKAIVIAAGDDKVALVGIDLGRGPTEAMMKIIRQEIADKAGIRHVLITGSHTHHGPVIELVDEPGLGKGKFDVAVELFAETAPAARRGHPRRRQGPEARQDRRCDRIGDL